VFENKTFPSARQAVLGQRPAMDMRVKAENEKISQFLHKNRGKTALEGGHRGIILRQRHSGEPNASENCIFVEFYIPGILAPPKFQSFSEPNPTNGGSTPWKRESYQYTDHNKSLH
jgi:hypothetical protein